MNCLLHRQPKHKRCGGYESFLLLLCYVGRRRGWYFLELLFKYRWVVLVSSQIVHCVASNLYHSDIIATFTELFTGINMLENDFTCWNQHCCPIPLLFSFVWTNNMQYISKLYTSGVLIQPTAPWLRSLCCIIKFDEIVWAICAPN